MPENDERTNRRSELANELVHHREQIDWHLALLVTGCQELEDMAAEQEGRPCGYVYSVINDETCGQVEIRWGPMPT